jgi:DNA-binding MarR family transcriptional regulator
MQNYWTIAGFQREGKSMETEGIKQVMRRLYKAIAVFNHEFDFYDYSLTEGVTIGIIARHSGIIAADICHEIKIDKGHLSRILKKLEARGVISRSAAPAGGQEKRIALTQEGRQLYDEMQTLVDRCIEKDLQVLAADDREDFLKNIDRLESQLAALLPGQAPH